jgi:hypothetical protein
MKSYRVEVAITYTQHIEVTASSMEEAEATAFDQFDIDQAYQTAADIVWVTDIDNPSWLDQPLPAAPTLGETA